MVRDAEATRVNSTLLRSLKPTPSAWAASMRWVEAGRATLPTPEGVGSRRASSPIVKPTPSAWTTPRMDWTRACRSGSGSSVGNAPAAPRRASPRRRCGLKRARRPECTAHSFRGGHAMGSSSPRRPLREASRPRPHSPRRRWGLQPAEGREFTRVASASRTIFSSEGPSGTRPARRVSAGPHHHASGSSGGRPADQRGRNRIGRPWEGVSVMLRRIVITLGATATGDIFCRIVASTMRIS